MFLPSDISPDGLSGDWKTKIICKNNNTWNQTCNTLTNVHFDQYDNPVVIITIIKTPSSLPSRKNQDRAFIYACVSDTQKTSSFDHQMLKKI